MKQKGFSDEGEYIANNPVYAKNKPATLSKEMVVKVAEQCVDCDIRDDVLGNPVCYEAPEETVNISIDDVNVKRQESNREKGGKTEKGKRNYVHNTIVHVAKEDKNYSLNGHGMKLTLHFLYSMLCNKKTARPPQFK